MNGSEAMADNTLKFASADLAVAHELADVADRISKAYFSPNGVSADTKADGSPVTEADHRIERELRAYLGRVLPQDAFIGEEFGAYGDAARRWIIDPIDGTVGFSAGLPWWSTLIGGEEDGEVVTGVITAPALRRRWWASAKGGAWTADWSDATAGTPAPLAVSTADELARSRTAVWPPLHRASEENRAKADRLTARSGDGRLLSDWTGTCHGGLLVADGSIDAFLLVAAGPWDIAAAVPIVEEAGGRFSDLNGGRSLRTRAALFTNGRLHQQVLDAISLSGTMP